MSQIIMTDVRAALVGACGKMGTGIVRKIMSVEGITVAAAFDLVRIGEDIGEVAGIGKIGVPVSDAKDLATVLKDAKVDGTVVPAGEGAGYAGGIVSAAVDGERCAMSAKEYIGV